VLSGSAEEEKIIPLETREEPPVFADVPNVTDEELHGGEPEESSEMRRRREEGSGQDELPLV
jgi:hypothetical protein